MVGKLLVFLSQANIDSQLSNTYTLPMEAIQIEIGSSTQFFPLLYCDFGCLTTISWLSRLWESISKFFVRLQNPSSSLLPPQELMKKEFLQCACLFYFLTRFKYCKLMFLEIHCLEYSENRSYVW